jgi:hypothetical protein
MIRGLIGRIAMWMWPSRNLRKIFEAQRPFWVECGFTNAEIDQLFDSCIADIEGRK